MQKYLPLIRGILFDISLIIWTPLVAICGLPLGLFPQTAWLLYKIWSKGVMIFLKIICRIDYQIYGLEHIKDGPYIFLSKHQSMWDTIILLIILKHPSYVIKKELLYIPFYGWYMKNMHMIPVNRAGKIKAFKQMMHDVRIKLQKGRSIIFFPQGTRVPVRSNAKDFPYHFSTLPLYHDGYQFVPIALNAGLYWPKGLFKAKYPGTIKMTIMPPLPSGLSGTELRHAIQDNIESESTKLANEP